MNGNNGRRRRLDVLEVLLEPPTEGDADQWQAAWDSALHTLLGTMAPEHVQGLGEEIQRHECPDPSRPYGRLWAELHARVAERVGAAPGVPPRYPDAPLALPAALAEVYLRGGPNFAASGARCQTCDLRLPTAGQNVAVMDSGDGWHFSDTGESCREPTLAHLSEGRVMWRPLVLFPQGCPLCGGSLAPVVQAEGAATP